MPHTHDHHNVATPRTNEPHHGECPMNGHPPWCSRQHCFVNEDGVQVHHQEPVRWEDGEVRFESQLFFPDGEHPPTIYLKLSIENLLLTWRVIDTFLPTTTARRLRDQLTAHLDVADSCPHPRAQDAHGDTE
ncbi:MAG: hypothetical protein ACRDQX_06935 [Pseudonocardiaceae bacterium]